MSPDDGGPAFPRVHPGRADLDTDTWATPGMTLRDYFAAQALPGLIERPGPAIAASLSGVDLGRMLAGSAYAIADAMLVERKRVPA